MTSILLPPTQYTLLIVDIAGSIGNSLADFLILLICLTHLSTLCPSSCLLSLKNYRYEQFFGSIYSLGGTLARNQILFKCGCVRAYIEKILYLQLPCYFLVMNLCCITKSCSCSTWVALSLLGQLWVKYFIRTREILKTKLLYECKLLFVVVFCCYKFFLCL